MITKKLFSTLEDLFDYYNEALFNSSLPDCVVNLSRHRAVHGFFAKDQWKSKEDRSTIHEIALNPDSVSRPEKEWHATLVHEMVQMWQHMFGTPSRAYYYNKEWADKMESIGLMPSDTGEEGGKKVGQGIKYYIIEDGLFDLAFAKIREEDNLILPCAKSEYFVSLDDNNSGDVDNDIGGETLEAEEYEGSTDNEDKPKKNSKIKVKYTCTCGNKVWGKPELNITCNDCNDPMISDPITVEEEEY